MSPKATDPREAGPVPPFPQQPQSHPGSVHKMNPAADHGENSYSGTGKLKGRVAVVTGGDSGIGRAVAIAFAKEGAHIVLSFLSEEEDDAQDTAAFIREAGSRVLTVAGDLQQTGAIRKLLDSTVSEFGKLDILVNNAAYQMSHDDIDDLSSEELERTFRTNVFTTFLLARRPFGFFLQAGSFSIRPQSRRSSRVPLSSLMQRLSLPFSA